MPAPGRLAAAGVPRIVIVGRNAERGQLAAKSIAELAAETHFVAGGATDPNIAATVAAEADHAKAAIVMFTRTIAIEEKRYGIRANAQSPAVSPSLRPGLHVEGDGL